MPLTQIKTGKLRAICFEKNNFAVNAISFLSYIRKYIVMHSHKLRFTSCIILMMLLLSGTIKSQEMWGVTTSNFAGSNGAILNPASLVTSKLYLDVNLATFDIFFQNNYGYIHQKDFSPFKLLVKNPEFPEYGEDDMPFDHFWDVRDKFIYSSQLIKGPSMMLAYGRHAFALHTGARIITSTSRIPYDIANFGYYGLDYSEQHNVNYVSRNLHAASVFLGEIGLSYAYAFRKIGNEEWVAGITVKKLFSPAGAYVSADNLDYIVVNDSTINIKNMNGEVGYSFPMNYDNNEYPDSGPFIKGGGYGIDIGFAFQNKDLSYQKKRFRRLCSQKYINYSYRLGISLIDLGYVTYDQNSQLHVYNDISKYWISIDTINYYNFNELTRTMSREFYGNENTSFAGDKVRLLLPTALSIQGDYHIYRKWYGGLVWIQPVHLGKSYMRRPAQIALIPRYESPKLELALPLSLYDYRMPRVGFSVRYYFLTIGTDDLLGLVGYKNFTGLDFYASIKINFRKGFCGRFKRDLPCENDEYGIRSRGKNQRY